MAGSRAFPRGICSCNASHPRRPRAREVRAKTWRRGRPRDFDEALVVTDEPRQDFIALDDALEALAKFDERKSRVVELRFFGGLSVEETASVLNVSPDTVMRDWRLAKAWLRARCAAIIRMMTPKTPAGLIGP